MKKTYHGLSKSRLYAVYCAMKRRCYCERDKNFKNYGGRGICICEEWLGDSGFFSFYNWAYENGYDGWDLELGVPRNTLVYRLKSGRPYEIVFTTVKDIHVLQSKAVV